jgi:hypothetical protein
MNIFIDWPTFSGKSNGIRCLYELSLYLSQAGYPVYGVPRKLNTFFKSLKNLPPEYKDILIAENPFGSPNDVFIAAETVSARTIHLVRRHGIRVIWWQLAPYCLLDGQLWPMPGDMSLPFSSYVDPNANHHFYYQPRLESHWRAALLQPQPGLATSQTRICVYNGKGRLKGIKNNKILDLCSKSELVPITRATPATRASLIELLQSSHGLISFDEFSAINLEAASLGVPVFLANPLFEQRCRQNFAVEKFQSLICLDAAEFFRLVSIRMEHKLFPMELDELVAPNQSTLANWKLLLDDPSKFSAHRVTPEAICELRRYTRSLKRRRAISVHYGGQAGSSWLASSYVAALSTGRIGLILMVSVRILDYAYICIGQFLIGLERLPILRRLIANTRSSQLLPVYKSGQRTFSLK